MNEDENIDLSQLIDKAVKGLFRVCPTLVTRLAGMDTAAEDIRVEDPNLNLPELRADHVFVVPEGAIYLEYQLNRDDRLLPAWAAKWGGLSKQLAMPVVLVVLYLQKGNYATFPAQMASQVGHAEKPAVAVRHREHRRQGKDFARLAKREQEAVPAAFDRQPGLPAALGSRRLQAVGQAALEFTQGLFVGHSGVRRGSDRHQGGGRRETLSRTRGSSQPVHRH